MYGLLTSVAPALLYVAYVLLFAKHFLLIGCFFLHATRVYVTL